eukprot:6130223-Prorocentrum_lima.AAC.1
MPEISGSGAYMRPGRVPGRRSRSRRKKIFPKEITSSKSPSFSATRAPATKLSAVRLVSKGLFRPALTR